MGLPTEKLTAAVLRAVENGALSMNRAERLLGQMTFEATGKGLPGRGETTWRNEFTAVGISEALLDEAAFDMGLLEVTVGGVLHSGEVEAMTEHLRVLGDPESWPPAVSYDSLALAIIDSVWSIGVRYQGVINVLARYSSLRRAEGEDANWDRPGDLAQFVDRLGGPIVFAERVNNRQRTSSRSGILKAEAVFLQARMLSEEGVATSFDLLKHDRLESLRGRWTSVPGQGSGLSWDYLLMLAGNRGVKADRMVRRFVADALGLVTERAVSAEKARALVIAAAASLKLDLSQLDYAIWRYQSGT